MKNIDIEELRTVLKQLASCECWCDGSNFAPCYPAESDEADAYSEGKEDGESGLARQLLKQFFNETK